MFVLYANKYDIILYSDADADDPPPGTPEVEKIEIVKTA